MQMLDQIDSFAGHLKREEGLSAGTIAQYSADCRRLAHWLLEHQPELESWSDVQARHLRAFINAYNPAPARNRRLLSSWRKLWTYLGEVEELTLHRGPFEMKRVKLRKLQPKYLTTAEVSKLIAAVQGRSPEQARRDKALISFLYGTGCRISEVLGLTIDNIEFEEDGQPYRIRVLGKGEKERTLHLSPTAQRALGDWLKLRHLLGDGRSAYVFCHLGGKKKGQPLTARSVERAVKVAGQKAGLPAERCTPHKLRHSHATALMKAGRRLEEVQEILGHESIATTRIYAHLEPERLKAAAASLPDI